MLRKGMLLVVILMLLIARLTAQPWNALSLDGTDDHIVIDMSTVDLTGDLTIEFWIYRGSTINGQTVISKGYTNEFDITIWTNYLKYYSGDGSEYDDVPLGAFLPAYAWSHFAVVRDTAEKSLTTYLNGERISIASYDNTVQSSDRMVCIGARYYSSTYVQNFLLAKLEDLRIWNVTRTQCEIQCSMNSGLTGNEEGLIAYYNFNQGTAGESNSSITTLNDLSANNLEGTLYNFNLTGSSSNWISSDVCNSDGNFADTKAPVVDNSSLSNIEAACEVTSLTAPTATDVCDGTINGTTDALLPIKNSTTITWSYTDNAGNSSSQTQNIVITATNDAPVPDIETLSDIVAECEVPSLTPPAATDYCDGPIEGTTDALLPVTSSATITWTYTDSMGNTSTQTQNIIIDDITNPSITCQSSTVYINDPNSQYMVQGIELDPAEVSDNCALASVYNDINNTQSLAGEQFSKGSHVVNWTAIDEDGNTSTCISVVKVGVLTGEEELNDDDIVVFPNPVESNLTIIFGDIEVKSIVITDINGRRVLVKSSVDDSESINISGFDSGVFFLNIYTDKKIYVKKIIKK